MAVLADRAEHQREDFTLDMGPSTLSHHMKTLREAGLTRHRFEGTRCLVSPFSRFSAILDGVLQAVASSEHSTATASVTNGDRS